MILLYAIVGLLVGGLLNVLADAQGSVAHDRIRRSGDVGVGQIELCLATHGFAQSQRRLCLSQFRLEHVELRNGIRKCGRVASNGGAGRGIS